MSEILKNFSLSKLCFIAVRDRKGAISKLSKCGVLVMIVYVLLGVSPIQRIARAGTPRYGGYITDWFFTCDYFFASGIVPGATIYSESNAQWAIVYRDANNYALTPNYIQATNVSRRIATSPYNYFYSADRDPRYDSAFYVYLEVPKIRALKFGSAPYRTTRHIDLWNTAGAVFHRFYVTCDENSNRINSQYVRP